MNKAEEMALSAHKRIEEIKAHGENEAEPKYKEILESIKVKAEMGAFSYACFFKNTEFFILDIIKKRLISEGFGVLIEPGKDYRVEINWRLGVNEVKVLQNFVDSLSKLTKTHPSENTVTDGE